LEARAATSERARVVIEATFTDMMKMLCLT